MARLTIAQRYSRLSARERRLITLVGGALGVLLVVGLPVGLEVSIHARQSDATELRAALDAVQGARAHVRERQARKDAIASRYAKRAPALPGFIEELARAEKLEVTDSVDRPDVPHGKKFTERATVIHLKKAGLAPIAKFLEGVEKSGYPVAVSRLDVRRRTGEPDSYDVEVGISAYDRNTETPAAAVPAGSATP